jgi:phospholipase/lecithinase/hemolysin
MLENAAPLSAAIASYNTLLASGLENFKAGRNVTVKLVDTHVPFNEALDNPTEYGAPDATCYNADGVSCVSGQPLRLPSLSPLSGKMNSELTRWTSPQLWFNDYHPGVEIQRLVGAQVAQTWGGFFECVDSVLCTE